MLKKYTAKTLGMVIAWGEPFATAIAIAIAKGTTNANTATKGTTSRRI